MKEKYKFKTNNTKEYKYVIELRNGLVKYTTQLFTTTYGKGLARKLYYLGCYTYINIYDHFNIWQCKHMRLIKQGVYLK